MKLDPEQKFTQPPPRFNEASLVKTLEERGIGRPSTYASIINTIQDRDYVKKIQARFVPTEIGTVVTGLLVKNFPYIFDPRIRRSWRASWMRWKRERSAGPIC